MSKNLVIVESPAKAKTIEGFLGKEFQVKSCYGHIRDLQKKDLSVDVDNDFTPSYEIPADKQKIVTELKSYAKNADMIWLATDEDREGEAISWHLAEALKLSEKKTKRIVFHEITKSAILNAIEHPRGINKALVDAQQARRVLDRLVGFKLSPVLWKKISFNSTLSAGRVQSVAVRLIVEREREISAHKTASSYRITALLKAVINGKNVLVKAELPKRFDAEEEAKAFLESCIGAKFSVGSLEKKPAKKSPSAPFTTSTLQQEASRKLGFSVSQTMVVAQKLYEAGKITYMRTDSVNLSDTAITACKEEIVKNYGERYLKTRHYRTKSKGAQEAHEAIRPTYINNKDVAGDRTESRLYDLIWKRTVASQMSDAEIEKTIVKIDISGSPEQLVANGEVIKFEGFLKVYSESSDEDEETEKNVLPPLTVGDKMDMDMMTASQKFTKHPPRYTEASLVRKLEELGIGRPSTYAPIISTVQKRGYVVKEDRPGEEREYKVYSLINDHIGHEIKKEITGAEKAKLFPTDIGMVVNDFLLNHFDNIMDYNFTADVEKEFDKIAQGQKKWNEMIGKFYGPFNKKVENTLETSKRATGERELGKDSKTGKKIVVKVGKYGPIVQIGEKDDAEKPRFASLRKNQSIENITLEEALDLFKLPRELGKFENDDVVVSIGRFGPYIRHGSKFYSLPKDDDPHKVALERAIELVQEKRKFEQERVIRIFEENKEVQILKGKYGPFIKIGKLNYRIPKDREPQSLTLEDCLTISNEAGKTKTRAKTKTKKNNPKS